MKDHTNLLLQILTTCGSLLNELQVIWDEVGESEDERVKMLHEIEQECLDVCGRKVNQANRRRAQLKQEIAEAEEELAAMCSEMGDPAVHIRLSDKNPETLKAVLEVVLPLVEEMKKRKADRKKRFIEVLEEIMKIKGEFCVSDGAGSQKLEFEEADLSMQKLEELHLELQALQKQKSLRMKLVMDHLNCLYSLCSVLGLDFKNIVDDIHPSLWDSEFSKSLSDHTIQQLKAAVKSLRDLKLHRMQQLQDLAALLLELWNLMDTPIEEQQSFYKVTRNIAASEDEITEPNVLSPFHIHFVEAEVSRLEKLKASMMMELIKKKKADLEDICKKTHLVQEKDGAIEMAIHAIESGSADAMNVLEQTELQIATVKEEALNRKEILEKIEKWRAACEEEKWLQEYNMDTNRYNAGRGSHLALKRAEKARGLVNKIPAMVNALAAKIMAWENENRKQFNYDGVRFLSTLKQYLALRKEKELEQKRQRERKKILTEQEALYGSKPSPSKNQSLKKAQRPFSGSSNNRNGSLGAPMLQTPTMNTLHSVKPTPNTRNTKRNDIKDNRYTASERRGGPDMVDPPVKLIQNSMIPRHKADSIATRKPFSPISCEKPSKPNNASGGDMKIRLQHTEKVLQADHMTFSTPPKLIPAAEGEITVPQTTKATLHLTPSTVSIPVNESEEEIEYSFEERRAGFMLLQ